MNLPKIKYPIFSVTLPISGEMYFRPFTVKEEKILLIAGESDLTSDKLRAIRQIVNNCLVNFEGDISSIPSFELEYLFLKIRGQSVSNIVEMKVTDGPDSYELAVDIEDIKLEVSPEHKNVCMITDVLGIVMGYPSIEQLSEFENDTSDDAVTKLIRSCAVSLFDDSNVWNLTTTSDEDKNEFMESITSSGFKSIVKFFETMPVLTHNAKYRDKNGDIQTITLKGINDFFQ